MYLAVNISPNHQVKVFRQNVHSSDYFSQLLRRKEGGVLVEQKELWLSLTAKLEVTWCVGKVLG